MPRRKADSAVGEEDVMDIRELVQEPGVREKVVVKQTRDIVGDSPRDALERLDDADRKAAKANGESKVEEDIVQFSDAITKAGNRIVVYRYAPKIDPATNTDITGQVDVLPPPFRTADLEDHIKKTHGGGKYHISAFGTEDDQVEIAGKNLDIPGDPIVIGPQRPRFQFEEYPPGAPRGLFEEEENRDPTHRIMQDQLKTMEHRLRVAAINKNIKRLSKDDDDDGGRAQEAAAAAREAEALRLELVNQKADADRQRLEQERRAMEERQRREVDGLKTAFDAKFERLMEQMERAKDEGGGTTKMIELQAKLDTIKMEQKMEMERLFMTLKETSRPRDDKPDAMVQIMPLFMKSMEAIAQGNQQQSNMMMQMMQQNSQAQAAQQQSQLQQAQQQQTLLMTLMTKNTENMIGLISDDKDRKNPLTNMKEVMSIAREVAETMGGGGSSEPKAFGDRVLDAIEKIVPDVLEFVRERQERGLEVTKREIQNQARKLVTDISQSVGEEVRAARGGSLPPARQAATAATRQTASAAPVVIDADDRPAADYVNSSPMQPAQAAPPQAIITPAPVQEDTASPPQPAVKPLPENFADTEARRRVEHVLRVLQAEVQVLPGMQTWVDEALKHLPKKVLVAVVASENDEQLHEAVKPWGSQELMDSIWNVIKDSDDAREWLVDGINELKDRYNGVDENGEEEADGE